MKEAVFKSVEPIFETWFVSLQEKLRLDIDEETAVEWMQQLINESSSALMPALMEQTHRIAQYWR
jgi:phosphatidylinositol 3-kinase